MDYGLKVWAGGNTTCMSEERLRTDRGCGAGMPEVRWVSDQLTNGWTGGV